MQVTVTVDLAAVDAGRAGDRGDGDLLAARGELVQGFQDPGPTAFGVRGPRLGSMRRGIRQHTRRQVPATEECGCLQAKRDDEDAKSKTRQFGRSPRSAGQLRWNRGKFTDGTSRPEENTSVRRVCTTEGCGQEAAGTSPQQRGWVRIHVTGSTEPARDYCSDSCATVGIAHAELRMDNAA
ncbi:hypothetical protein AB0919_39675 [Streptomyces sp. NPDC046994]|uniref:hypothetical protein n=1 Tax=Streptomyces sp. NPDC046994 TaxID=3155735 RepID=UPI003456D022